MVNIVLDTFDADITVIQASVKPEYAEYAEYIRRYGYPEGGVFEMEMLSKCH